MKWEVKRFWKSVFEMANLNRFFLSESDRLSRREVISKIGLIGAPMMLCCPGALRGDEGVKMEPNVGDQRNPICRNSPLAGPYYRKFPKTAEPGQKGFIDAQRRWDLKEIRIGFLNEATREFDRMIQKKVQDVANQWCDFANISFRFVGFVKRQDVDKYDVSINFQPFKDDSGTEHGYGTYDSFLGTDSKIYQKDVPTMNLMFHPNLGARRGVEYAMIEYQRVILHEFGHVLGFNHEHQFPGVITWDEPALCRHGRIEWGWDCETVKEQIINAQKGERVGTKFDFTSIMEYEFPTGLGTIDGMPFKACRNADLSPMDKITASMAYPNDEVRVIARENLTVKKPKRKGKINQRGQVASFKVCVSQPEEYVITTSDMPSLLSVRRGLNGEVYSAAESAEGDNTCTLKLGRLEATVDYFIEVRARRPTRDEGMEFNVELKKSV